MSTEILTILYVIAAIVGGASYLPQIITLVKDNSGAKAINILTWSLWTGEMFIVSLYAIFVNGDMFFIFCSLVNNIGCVSVLFLAIRNRKAYNQLVIDKNKAI